jgi:hypothetical protein
MEPRVEVLDNNPESKITTVKGFIVQAIGESA